MGFSTQRTYSTSISKFSDVVYQVHKYRAQLILVTKDLSPDGGLRLLTIRFPSRAYVCVQISPKNCFLMLQGMKPDDYLSDLVIIRKFVKKMRDNYPHGIDFKLRKETIGSKHKDEIIHQLEAQVEFLQNALISKDPKKTYQHYIEQFGKIVDQDIEVHNTMAYSLNSAFAKAILVNGFRCGVDGTLKLKFDHKRCNVNPSYFDLKHTSYWDILKDNLKYVTRFLDS